MKNKNKKLLAGGGAALMSLTVLGVGAAVLSGAGAATLGGLDNQNIGSDVDVIAACDTDGISNVWTTDNDVVPGQMSLKEFTLHGVNAACDAGNYEFVVYDAAGVVLGEAYGTLALTAGSSGPIALSMPVDANAAVKAGLTIMSW